MIALMQDVTAFFFCPSEHGLRPQTRYCELAARETVSSTGTDPYALSVIGVAATFTAVGLVAVCLRPLSSTPIHVLRTRK